MANKLQRRRTASRRKLQLLRTLTNSKSVKRSSMILNVLQIYKLKVKLEEIQREYQNLLAIRNQYLTLLEHIQNPKEVKVEKITRQEFAVKVSCNKGSGDKLVSVLEAFDELGLNVLQARVCCNHFFAMEAIVVAQDLLQAIDAKDITQVVVKAIDEKPIR